MAKLIKEALEGKTTDKIIAWHVKHMRYVVGKARILGKVEALVGEGYTPLQIAEKLDIPESAARQLVHDIERLKK